MLLVLNTGSSSIKAALFDRDLTEVLGGKVTGIGQAQGARLRLGATDAAIDAPNFVNRNGATELEKGTELEALKPALEAMGHEVNLLTRGSGLHGIRVTAEGFDGGADRRREGVAIGD